ncbi:hypothetical protein [Cognatishimia activa]|uniref:DUF2806 domain-containing protein n=1 Tax=Cognatishimia activa TaxID=1715691 RepID=A0A0P1IS04_9RHOB|nr:hypothetical protein [Cognatishimia activa]CUI61277.1 hypothetical protein TA5113_00931 [Cognatishimia activa]CUK26294.1 hypothetical protein TA5114_02103 [Cognatishimia activa]
MTDQPSFEFVRNGTSLKLTGLGPVSQIAQYAADAIGVVGEPLGMVKDQLSSFRIQRAEAATIAMKRAEEIRKTEGLKLEPVSTKYLSNWLEGASCEDSLQDNVLELWAQLLSQSSSKFDARYLAYNEVLRKIGPQEAEVIRSFYNPLFLPAGGYELDGNLRRSFLSHDSESINETLLVLIFKLFQRGKLQFNANEFPKWNTCKNIFSHLLDGFLCELKVSYGETFMSLQTEGNPEIVLEHAGVAVVRSDSAVNEFGHRLTLKWATPTKIGEGLFSVLNRDRLNLDPDGDWQKTRIEYGKPTTRIPEKLRNHFSL